MRIIDYLEQSVFTSPDKVFITQSDGVCISYHAFWEEVCRKAGILSQEKQPRQAKVLRTTQTIDYLTSYFACQKCGVVVVPLEHNLPAEKFAEIEQLLEGQNFPVEASDILFTTGTTGVPKGVVLSHKALMTDADNLVEAHGYKPGVTFIINGPLNHFGSHSKVLAIVRSGASMYLMEGMKNLDDFFKAAESIQGRIATFLVPASIRMLVQFASDRLQTYADRIDFIETGAAPITQTDMQNISRLLPQSRLFNTYAGSEIGVVCTYNYNDGICRQSCVGPAFPHSHFEVNNGVVVCFGDGLMMGYLGQPLRECVESVETSDLGLVDEEGRLYLVGRQSDLINVGGLKVSPLEVEEVAASVIEGMKDCICISQPHPLMGAVPKLLVVMKDGMSLNKRIVAKAMRGCLEAYKVPVDIVIVDQIERTYNGKLNRKFYARVK